MGYNIKAVHTPLHNNVYIRMQDACWPANHILHTLILRDRVICEEEILALPWGLNNEDEHEWANISYPVSIYAFCDSHISWQPGCWVREDIINNQEQIFHSIQNICSHEEYSDYWW